MARSTFALVDPVLSVCTAPSVPSAARRRVTAVWTAPSFWIQMKSATPLSLTATTALPALCSGVAAELSVWTAPSVPAAVRWRACATVAWLTSPPCRIQVK